MGPEKGPRIHGSIWAPRKLGAIELLLQEYTLGRRAQSHELRLHKPQRKYSKSVFVTQLTISEFGQQSHRCHGSA